MVAAIVTCGGFALFPIFFIWYMGSSLPRSSHLVFLPWMLFVAVLAWIIFPRVLRIGQSYALEVDRDGITIQRFRGRREWRERVPRERITDVRIGFGQIGKSGRSSAWLTIAVRPWYRKNVRLLHDLGGDKLARVADAVREGLGLEPVEWPSGRPRGSKRTASDDSEWVKALLFGVMFLIAGSFFAINGSLDAWKIHDRLHGLRQTTCVLLEKSIIGGAGEHHEWGRHSNGHYQAWTRVRYEVGGVSRTVEGDLFPTDATENGRLPRDVLWNMNVGKSYPLWIDDRNPTRVYLSRGDETPWAYSIMIGVGTLFAVPGLACLVEGIVTGPRRRARRLP
jgi:hypothetical protein